MYKKYDKYCHFFIKNKMMATASNAIPNIVLLLNLSIIALKQFIYLLMYVSTQFRASPFERALFSALNRVSLKN